MFLGEVKLALLLEARAGVLLEARAGVGNAEVKDQAPAPGLIPQPYG